jgi:RNA recognition motif-containing protein
MAGAASGYNLGDICTLLFNPDANSAAQSKKKKTSSAPNPLSNPFAVFASPFADAARSQAAVVAQLQAGSRRRKDEKDIMLKDAGRDKEQSANKKSKSSENATQAVNTSSDSGTSKNRGDKKTSAASTSGAVAVAVAIAAAASATSHASKNEPLAAAVPTTVSSGKAPMNGVVNGIVYKDGQRVTNPNVSPRLPPGERVTDAGKDERTVFVGNVPVAIKLKHIKRHFAPCGAVDSVRLRSLPVASPKLSRKGAYATKDFREGASSCNAYVVFEDAASVPAALKLNGSELGGHHVRVDTVGGSARTQKFNNRLSLFVGNLDYRVNEEALHAHFSKVGGEGVVAVRCIRDKATSFGKGFAYVHFSSVDSLSAALKLDGKLFEGRPLRVSRSDGKASLKRARPSDASTTRAAASPVSQQRVQPKTPTQASPAAPGSEAAKKLKKPRHVPRPGATQPTLPPNAAPAARALGSVTKSRGSKVSLDARPPALLRSSCCDTVAAGEAGRSSWYQEEERTGDQEQGQVYMLFIYVIVATSAVYTDLLLIRRDKKLAAASKKKQKATKK